jgi:hypothetical protein
MILAGAWCLLVAMSARATDAPTSDAELLARAEASFRQARADVRKLDAARRQFAAAADDFLELHRRGVRSPALYFDLGNAALLADRLPRAIWAYHRGLALDPNHAVLRDHLAFARERVNYPPGDRGRPAPDRWPAWLPRPTLTVLLLASGIAYSLAWLGGAWWYVTRTTPALLATAALALVAVTAGAWYTLDVRDAERDRAEPLVVVARDGTPLQRGNGANYPRHPDAPTLPAGLEARLLHRRGGWLQIRLATGEIGWVPADSVLVDEP